MGNIAIGGLVGLAVDAISGGMYKLSPTELSGALGASSAGAVIKCRDKKRSSAFLARILGCSAAVPFYHFMVVQLANNVSLDFMEKGGPISVQHYAFLIDENEFGATFSRIRDEGLRYWADPGKSRPNEINHNDGGSGVYFEDLDGHILEVITRPYGGG